MMRRLLSTRRLVPLDRIEEYDALWARVREAVERHGGHAWRFRERRRTDHHIEFIESRELDALLERPAVREARETLDEAFGPGAEDDWEEANPT